MSESLASLRRERDELREVLAFDVTGLPGLEDAAIEQSVALGVDTVRLLEACEAIAAAGLKGAGTYAVILAECPLCHVWRETGPFGVNLCTCEAR